MRTALTTLTSKIVCQSPSSSLSKGFMMPPSPPRLLTSTSTAGSAAITALAPFAVEIAGDALDLRLRHGGLDLVERPVDARLRAAVDPYDRTLLGEALGDGVTDARGRRGDERGLAGEIEVHAAPYEAVRCCAITGRRSTLC